MKKSVFMCAIAASLFFCSCMEKAEDPKMMIDTLTSKENFSKGFEVTPKDEYVSIKKGLVTISPLLENQVYTLSGYFNGQVLCTTKNTVLKLDGVYVENNAGKPALKCTAKTEISTVSGSVNYLVSTGRGYSDKAALEGKRDLVLGGSGTLYVKGGNCHAVEADDIKIKGSGTYFLQGTKNGSAINCVNFAVEGEKTFEAYLLNAKNGIKADLTISIASGKFFSYNNGTALKTETSKNPEKKVHSIKLEGGEFYIYKNDRLYITDDNAYTNTGAVFVEEAL